MPGLRAGSPVGGVQEATDWSRTCLSPSFSPSLPLSLNKQNLKKKKGTQQGVTDNLTQIQPFLLAPCHPLSLQSGRWPSRCIQMCPKSCASLEIRWADTPASQHAAERGLHRGQSTASQARGGGGSGPAPGRGGSPGKRGLYKSWTRSTAVALAGWLSWLERHPIHQKVVGSIPHPGTYLGPGFASPSGRGREATECLCSLTLIILSCSLSLSLSPSI